MKATIRYAAAAAGVFLFASTAIAQAPDAARRQEAAWKWLDQAMAPTLTEEQRPKLLWAAYNATASALCHEVTVDENRLGGVLATLLPAEDDGKISPEQRHHLENSLMVHLGAAMGIYAAENADHLTEFCGEAVALRDDKELTNDLFLPKAEEGDTAPK
ncbi:hypothetical protein [Iodidimonas sp. SYSU 1G8]|uniref:hypothetical protein n=1 Tax=Iodidimonas sp. SYSU 1G8 TaxID=3133967 RepID=UPI0031FE6A40